MRPNKFIQCILLMVGAYKNRINGTDIDHNVKCHFGVVILMARRYWASYRQRMTDNKMK